MKLLIVDDEEKIRLLIEKYARLEGHTVATAKNGLEAVEYCQTKDVDIIIMDVMMPELDGFSAAKMIRKTKNIPIVFLTARSEEYDRIHGFEIGADDYVTKPFSSRELMLRIETIYRRIRGDKSQQNILEFQGFHLNMTAGILKVDGVEATLANRERALLFYLCENKGVALPRENILEAVWGYDFYGDDRTLDTHIKTLRQRLGKYKECIKTIRGLGYRFDCLED